MGEPVHSRPPDEPGISYTWDGSATSVDASSPVVFAGIEPMGPGSAFVLFLFRGAQYGAQQRHADRSDRHLRSRNVGRRRGQ